jgi:ABC-type sugar transport system substrate-binding protein
MAPWILVSLGCARRMADPDEFQALQESDGRTAATRGGVEVRFALGEADPGLQRKQITDAISAPAAARPVAVVADLAGAVGFERLARTTLAADVGWVLTTDNSPMLPVLRREFPGRLIAWACVNNDEIGRLQARMVAALRPGGGGALVIEGPTGTSTAIQRRRGLEEGLRETGVRIVKTLSCDWKVAGAEKATATWLGLAGKTTARPDLVIGQNDEMAEGALRALQARKPEWGKVRAIGCDGLPARGQRLVREGLLAATIVTPSGIGAAIDLVVKSLRGQDVPLGVEIPVRPHPSLEELASLPG